MIPNYMTVWMAKEAKAKLEAAELPIPKLKDHEVLLDVHSCGMCHSDLHLINNDWQFSTYPLVPGHEVIGKVIARGSAVTMPLETVVGVGWQRSACLECDDCLSGNDNTCDHKGATCVGNYGGYANYHVSDSRFCFPMPKGAESPEFAPMLCGGATVYSPLSLYTNRPNEKYARVGVVGLGGLGHIAVKMAKAMGHEVTVFSSSPNKKQEAEEMGAHHFVASNNPDSIAAIGRRLDMVLVTANVDLDWNSYISTLRTDGTLCFVGIPPSSFPLNVVQLLDKRLKIAASPIASRHQIKSMLEFCATQKVNCEIETFNFKDVNAAIEKVKTNSVRFRAVLAK